MKDITIYTTSTCPYCHAAKSLLARKGLKYNEIDVTYDPDLRRTMTAKAGGRRTVPQIFVNGAHVGDCDDIHALDAAGKLDGLLVGA